MLQVVVTRVTQWCPLLAGVYLRVPASVTHVSGTSAGPAEPVFSPTQSYGACAWSVLQGGHTPHTAGQGSETGCSKMHLWKMQGSSASEIPVMSVTLFLVKQITKARPEWRRGNQRHQRMSCHLPSVMGGSTDLCGVCLE